MLPEAVKAFPASDSGANNARGLAAGAPSALGRTASLRRRRGGAGRAPGAVRRSLSPQSQAPVLASRCLSRCWSHPGDYAAG